MKIGILTLPLHTNYGGILQAYALQTVLERMGHEVEVFDRTYLLHRSLWRNTISFVYRLCLRLGRKKVSLFPQKEYNERQEARRKYVNIFIHKYLNRRELTRYDRISPVEYDAIVVGSDQVWRKRYIPQQDIRLPFLEFTKNWNIKRIAYAASFGIDYWDYDEEETKMASKAIRRFDAVSTREQSGVELCREYLSFNDVKRVLDPTMLLDRNDYIKLIEESGYTNDHKGEIMLYVLDYSDEKRKFVSQCEQYMNMKAFETNSKYEVKGASMDEIIQPPVEQWLSGFRDSSLIITDSFHACVFSILFHKNFIVIGNKRRGLTRFQSLLSLFGLEDRMVVDNLELSLCDKSIDWDNVDDILNRMRDESLSFLRQSLS